MTPIEQSVLSYEAMIDQLSAILDEGFRELLLSDPRGVGELIEILGDGKLQEAVDLCKRPSFIATMAAVAMTEAFVRVTRKELDKGDTERTVT